MLIDIMGMSSMPPLSLLGSMVFGWVFVCVCVCLDVDGLAFCSVEGPKMKRRRCSSSSRWMISRWRAVGTITAVCVCVWCGGDAVSVRER